MHQCLKQWTKTLRTSCYFTQLTRLDTWTWKMLGSTLFLLRWVDTATILFLFFNFILFKKKIVSLGGVSVHLGSSCSNLQIFATFSYHTYFIKIQYWKWLLALETVWERGDWSRINKTNYLTLFLIVNFDMTEFLYCQIVKHAE